MYLKYINIIKNEFVMSQICEHCKRKPQCRICNPELCLITLSEKKTIIILFFIDEHFKILCKRFVNQHLLYFLVVHFIP